MNVMKASMKSIENPRLQCLVCGKWKRQCRANGERIMVPAFDKEGNEVIDKATGRVGDTCSEHAGQA